MAIEWCLIVASVLGLLRQNAFATENVAVADLAAFHHEHKTGGGKRFMKKILKLMSTISGHRSLAIPVPGKIAEAAAAMLEFFADHVTHRPPSGTAEGVRIALRATDLSIEKAKNELGYAPRPVEPALRDTIAYLLSTPTAS